MEYTKEQQTKIDYFRTSVRLQSPDTETDPAYIFTDDDLWAILSIVTPTHSVRHTIDSLPKTEFNFVMLLAKKEIYYRLATSTAPFYPLSAEGAELKKNVRFDHYMALVKQVSDDYALSIRMFNDSAFGEVQTYDTTVQSAYYSTRNYNLSGIPQIDITLSGFTQSSINLDWDKFNITNGLFSSYEIYLGENPIVDEYADEGNKFSAKALKLIADIHRTKFKIGDLKPDTEYFVGVKSIARNGLYGYNEKSGRTLPII